MGCVMKSRGDTYVHFNEYFGPYPGPEDDTKGNHESYTDSTDAGMPTPALAGREQEFVACGLKLNGSAAVTLGRVVKEEFGNPILDLNSTVSAYLYQIRVPPKPRVKHCTLDQVNENGSSMSNSYASRPQIRRPARKRKVEFNIDSDSNDYGHDVVKGRHKHSDCH
ncbi:hypothetical protein B9Z19DRAFT_1125445 [Tuber borchii]|uniref:Uncharacterized protein n=1 Tax=Tuber borchii TaxID=42251 RepID=A0A2T6ZUV1_TUBBO|nr:hypothetical protein B9Z19DRAFT_1125445 [Tuber borchii]